MRRWDGEDRTRIGRSVQSVLETKLKTTWPSSWPEADPTERKAVINVLRGIESNEYSTA